MIKTSNLHSRSIIHTDLQRSSLIDSSEAHSIARSLGPGEPSRPGMGLNRGIQAIRRATRVLKEGMETSNESEIGEQ